MYLKTKIKASQINNLSDARYFATFAQWMGFCFEADSPNFVELHVAREIIAWLHGPTIVGEFGSQPFEIVNHIATALNLKAIQTTISSNYEELHPQITTIIQRIPINRWTDANRLQTTLQLAQPRTMYFLLDFFPLQQDWTTIQNTTDFTIDFLQNLAQDYPIILSLPFDEQNVLAIVENINPLAINILGGNETKIGIRSFEDIAPIIDALEEELF